MRKRRIWRNDGVCPLGRLPVSGYVSKTDKHWVNNRLFGSYAVVIIVSGRGRYINSKGRGRDVSAGDAFLIFPGLEHSYGPAKGAQWQELYIVFDGPIFDLWRDHGLLREDQAVFHLVNVELALLQIEESLTLALNNPLSGIVVLQDLLMQLITTDESADRIKQNWLKTAEGLLKAADLQHAPIPDIASRMGDSYESFRKKFTEFKGTTPHQFRLGHLINRACHMMYEQPMTNGELADALGFCNEFHFSRIFKKTMGMTPRTFRHMLSLSGRG